MRRISRRDFLKLTGLGAAASVARLSLVQRTYQLNTPAPARFATQADCAIAATCWACPRGCGLIVHTAGGRIQWVEGNPAHPLNRGEICQRGEAAWHNLSDKDRVQGPLKNAGAGRNFRPVSWQAAIAEVGRAFRTYRPGEIVFLLGLFPDHLYDLVQRLAGALGGAQVLRYGAPGDQAGSVALMDAAQKLFGAARRPYFDTDRAEVIFSFGADFSESWLSPAAGRRAYLVQFEPRGSQTAAHADEWLPVEPGSAALLARALAVLGLQSGSDDARSQAAQAAELCGLPLRQLERLARLFFQAPGSLAVPGKGALAQGDGLAAAESILALNILAGNLGRQGGLHLVPDLPVHPGRARRPNTAAEIETLIGRMHNGGVKALFVHSADPICDLPEAYAFRDALQKVEMFVSFSPYMDETTAEADYIFPDRAPLESWGYHVVLAGCDRPVISAMQPVAPPLYDTRATVDVLLAAAHASGDDLAARLAYRDELDFIRQSVAVLADQGGIYQAADLPAFWALWQEHGGWWKKEPGLMPPVAIREIEVEFATNRFVGADRDDELRLLLFDGGAARPGRPEISTLPWVEISPETARQAGASIGDRVRVISAAGEILALVYEVAGMRPGVIAVPLVVEQRIVGLNPLNLLGKRQNESGELALGGVPLRIEPVL